MHTNKLSHTTFFLCHIKTDAPVFSKRICHITFGQISHVYKQIKIVTDKLATENVLVWARLNFNLFLSIPDLLLLLWLTSDDFTCQGETSRTGKG